MTTLDSLIEAGRSGLAHDARAANRKAADFVERAALLPKASFIPVTPSDPQRAPPAPRPIPLPLGGTALMYTRENLTQLYRCSHGELGRMLARKMAPLPIRIDQQILWFVDETLRDQAQVIRTLERWRKR